MSTSSLYLLLELNQRLETRYICGAALTRGDMPVLYEVRGDEAKPQDFKLVSGVGVL